MFLQVLYLQCQLRDGCNVSAFSSAFITENLPNPSPHQICPGSISTVDISMDNVRSQLLSLKTNSAMGQDGLHPQLFKQCASQLAYPFYLIFKSSLTLGVPADWKISHVIPTYKKGSRNDQLNYHLIHLTPIPYKSLQRLVSHTLFGFLECHSVLDNSQFGFQANRSVVDQLLLTYNKVAQWYDQGLTVDLILFGFVKAFDRFHHQTILDKRLAIGVSGNLWQWIASLLTNRMMIASVGGTLSNSAYIASGEPQGSVLRTLLFLIFVSHTYSTLTCNYMMFADDLKLYLQHPDSSYSPALFDLQHNINILASTAASWGLQSLVNVFTFVLNVAPVGQIVHCTTLMGLPSARLCLIRTLGL